VSGTVSNDDVPTTMTIAPIDEAMMRLLMPDDVPWSRLQRFVFSHRNVYERTLPPFYMIGLKPTTPMAPISVTDNEQSDDAFKRLCAGLFGHVDAFMTDQDGIIFDPYTTGYAAADEHPPYACAYIDGSIGLRDSISFTSRWEDKRPEPLPINLPGLWKMLRHALLAAERWPCEVGRYTGPLEVHLSLGNLGDTIISYPPDRLVALPRAWNHVPQWDAPRFAWTHDRTSTTYSKCISPPWRDNSSSGPFHPIRGQSVPKQPTDVVYASPMQAMAEESAATEQ